MLHVIPCLSVPEQAEVTAMREDLAAGLGVMKGTTRWEMVSTYQLCLS